jgi:hypothetical protein
MDALKKSLTSPGNSGGKKAPARAKAAAPARGAKKPAKRKTSG